MSGTTAPPNATNNTGGTPWTTPRPANIKMIRISTNNNPSSTQQCMACCRRASDGAVFTHRNSLQCRVCEDWCESCNCGGGRCMRGHDVATFPEDMRPHVSDTSAADRQQQLRSSPSACSPPFSPGSPPSSSSASSASSASFSASQSHPVFGHRRCVHCTNDPPCANNKCYCSHDDSTKYCPKHFDLGNVVTMLSVESGVCNHCLTDRRENHRGGPNTKVARRVRLQQQGLPVSGADEQVKPRQDDGLAQQFMWHRARKIVCLVVDHLDQSPPVVLMPDTVTGRKGFVELVSINAGLVGNHWGLERRELARRMVAWLLGRGKMSAGVTVRSLPWQWPSGL